LSSVSFMQLGQLGILW